MRKMKMKWNIKIAVGTLLLAGTVLLFGSGSVRTPHAAADARTNAENCRAAARAMSPAVPGHLREGWDDIADRSPELAIRAAHVSLKPVR